MQDIDALKELEAFKRNVVFKEFVFSIIRESQALRMAGKKAGSMRMPVRVIKVGKDIDIYEAIINGVESSPRNYLAEHKLEAGKQPLYLKHAKVKMLGKSSSNKFLLTTNNKISNKSCIRNGRDSVYYLVPSGFELGNSGVIEFENIKNTLLHTSPENFKEVKYVAELLMEYVNKRTICK